MKIDENGDVASIFDKQFNHQLLSAPARLAFQTEKPHDWPAWNMDWADQQKPPRGYVQGPAKVRVVENGPVRVAIEIERETEGSKFVQTIRLSAGDAGNRVEFGNSIDWHTEAAALKATFPLTAANPEATYNWDVGTIARTNDYDRKFEFPSHQWFDLTDQRGTYGVTILSDCKYAFRQAGRQNSAPHAALHSRSRHRQRARLQRPDLAGLGPSRIHLRTRRARCRLAAGSNGLASLALEPAADCLRNGEARWPARQELFTAQDE